MDAVIFDFDGTLVDTEPLHEAALRAALEPWGVPVREGMTIGLSDEDAIARACAEAGRDPLPEDEVLAVFREKVRRYTEAMDVERVIVFQGAVELLREVAAYVPVAICTAAMRDEVEPVVAWLGIADLVRATVPADDVTHKKPAPDAYRLACARVGVTPERALAIEDSPRGVRSAVDAGLVTLALEHTTPRDELAHAHAVVASTKGLTLADLRSVYAEHAG